MIEGYILLPQKSSSAYYGIDRGLFEPLLIESEFEKQIPNKKYTSVSSFYPDGWRKKAYQLYEANQIAVSDNFDILGNYEIAIQIKNLINPNIGEYEIFLAQVSDKSNDFHQTDDCFGYDFAYSGGDLYSAIKSGLFINRSETLFITYGSLLNENGLFDDPSLFEKYIKDFKEEARSETDSTFWIYRLTKA